MIYVIYGPQEALVKNRINEIIAEKIGAVDGFNYVYYSCLDTPLEDIVQDAITLPFGIDKKVIVIRQPFFLTGEKPKLEFDFDDQPLISYLSKPLESAVLIFECLSSKLASTTPLFKKLKEVALIEEIKDIQKQDWALEAGKILRKYQVSVDKEGMVELLERCGQDYEKLRSEIAKLSIFNSKITKFDVEALVARPLEDNTFLLSEKLIDKDIGGAIKLFRDLKMQQHEPVALISMVAKQIRFLYYVCVLGNQGMREEEIAAELQAHSYRVKLALRRTGGMRPQDLMAILNEMAKLDQAIKSGQVERFQAFELFLLKRIDPR